MARKTNEELAREVINGNWGNGQERKNRLEAAGYDYAAVQGIVNSMVNGYGTGNYGSYGYSGTKAPAYNSRYQSQIDSLLDQLLNRDPFSYDYRSDPTYQQYEEAYTRNGNRAMEDALGRLASRTGGLASSYAASAAQQQYNNYMDELSDIIPELEQLAYSMYLQEGNSMRDNLSILQALENQAYNRYHDELADYYAATSMGGGYSSGSSGSRNNNLSNAQDAILNAAQAGINAGNNAFSRPFTNAATAGLGAGLNALLSSRNNMRGSPILERALDYGNSDASARYLNDLVNRGQLSKDAAASIYREVERKLG